MYQNFFGLTDKPFSVTPDTRFLFLSPQHQGVINTLLYGIREKKGFLVLTGEVGTGKTTSIRALLNLLEEDVQTSLILNPLVSTVELLQCINRDFGCPSTAVTINELLDILNHFLLKIHHQGMTALVIIDEAQNLSLEAMEMTRLLSNLETETDKLIQIILAGQPELDEKLGDRRLRQLAQRIQIYCRLHPLDSQQTESYVHHRIGRAGLKPLVAFEKEALRELHKVSRGIPRIINTVCDLALLSAYARETRVITRPLIREAAREAPYPCL